ncbi:hypothetical protein [Helicobacter sp. 23-1045]
MREETNECNPKNGENIVDSANQIKFAESCTKTQNLTMDCHDFALQNLAMTENKRRIYKNRRICPTSSLRVSEASVAIYELKK